MNKRTIWIVGASSGIGLELVKKWLWSNHNVVASSRSASSSEALRALSIQFPHQLVMVDLDASDHAHIDQAVKKAWDAFGSIDRWFYNAGAYEVMKMEQWSEEAFVQMNEVNYLGAVRIMIPLSSKFIAQGHGEWIWNISLSSYFGLPYGGGYSAPKAALLNLAESIQPELKTKGISLRVINHGFVKTRLTRKNDFEMPQLMEPSDAAEQIVEALEREEGFEIRFPKALSRFLSFLRILPYTFALKLTSKALR